MCITICAIGRQSRFEAWDRVLRAGALGCPWGMGWGGRWKGGSGWGTRVHPWLIHVNVWQNPPQFCKVISLQLKLIKKIITCWDFYWNCVESINQEREKWLLDSTKSSYLWSWNKYLSIISFLLLQIFAVFLYRSYTYPTKLKPKYFIFPILM